MVMQLKLELLGQPYSNSKIHSSGSASASPADMIISISFS